MKILLITLGLLIMLAALGWLVGMILPRIHVARRSAKIKRPASDIWETITDRLAEPSWRTSLTSIKRLEDRQGCEVWQETSSDGKTLMQMTIDETPQREIVRKIIDHSHLGGTWTFTLAPGDDESCTLTIAEETEVHSPINRLLGFFLVDNTQGISCYLVDLAGKHGQLAEFQK